MAVIDGGVRQFFESPAMSWQPLAGGAAGEYVSTQTFPEADSRRVPQQFLPAAWEPYASLRRAAIQPLAMTGPGGVAKPTVTSVNQASWSRWGSTVALANVYYDFSFGSNGFSYSGAGAFGYVGAGAGLAWNHAEVNAPTGAPVQTGTNVSAAAAVMAGVGYDMGSWVADVGYRGLYINQINNSPTSDPNQYYEIDGNLIHEVRGTVRYRFN